MSNRDFTAACLRCFKFNGYNPEVHGSFCNVGCQIEYRDNGSLVQEGVITEDEAWEIFKKSEKEDMDRFLKRGRKSNERSPNV